MKEELDMLNSLLKKKCITYSEFNELIGNYFVLDYEELEDDYYLLKIMLHGSDSTTNNHYTDYVRLIK